MVPTDPYANLRSSVPTQGEIIRAFMDNNGMEALMWTTRRLPGGSRILMHADEPLILYDGDADKFYYRLRSKIAINLKETYGGETCNDNKFWERYNELLFTDRLRKGGAVS